MKKILLLLAFSLSAHGTQAATLIDFEDADQENISYRYKSLGLTLQSISNPYPMVGPFPSPEILPSIVGDVGIWRFIDHPELGVTAVSTGQGIPGDVGILMTFDFDISSLSLQGVDLGFFYGAPGVLRDEDEAVTLTAYDASGNKIGSTFSSINLPGPFDITPATISFPNMRYVAYNYTGNSYGFYAIDNISFSVTSVPESNSLGMLIAGLGLVGLIQRRRKAD